MMLTKRADGWSTGVQRILGLDKWSAQTRGYQRMGSGNGSPNFRKEKKPPVSLNCVYSSCVERRAVFREVQCSAEHCYHRQPVIRMDEDFIEIQQYSCEKKQRAHGRRAKAPLQRTLCQRCCHAGHSVYCVEHQHTDKEEDEDGEEYRLDKHRPLHQDLSCPRPQASHNSKQPSYRFPFGCRKSGKKRDGSAKSERNKVWPVLLFPPDSRVTCSFV